ncbi:mitochondrial import receptor subunit TOM5 homolog [Ziziphus jujuba]|uniref:Mitochondrial import receptor subunit TOM5 homolog n=1 Tax=Ziziphus jujuba TaxID=326968 RepID=A0A6P4ABQ4_ZIZJJ|nr:mitochondrial import receptor subunit TOM5 homolog [Ziziphus jujuba]
MADRKPAISVESVKAFLKSEYHDEDKWAHNMKLLRAVGLFAGSILLMRNYGHLMAV